MGKLVDEFGLNQILGKIKKYVDDKVQSFNISWNGLSDKPFYLKEPFYKTAISIDSDTWKLITLDELQINVFDHTYVLQIDFRVTGNKGTRVIKLKPNDYKEINFSFETQSYVIFKIKFAPEGLYLYKNSTITDITISCIDSFKVLDEGYISQDIARYEDLKSVIGLKWDVIEVSYITFTISEKTYTVEKGMTWTELINSDYNVMNDTFHMETFSMHETQVLWLANSGMKLIIDNVTPDDVILEQNYTVTATQV